MRAIPGSIREGEVKKIVSEKPCVVAIDFQGLRFPIFHCTRSI